MPTILVADAAPTDVTVVAMSATTANVVTIARLMSPPCGSSEATRWLRVGGTRRLRVGIRGIDPSLGRGRRVGTRQDRWIWFLRCAPSPLTGDVGRLGHIAATSPAEL